MRYLLEDTSERMEFIFSESGKAVTANVDYNFKVPPEVRDIFYRIEISDGN